MELCETLILKCNILKCLDLNFYEEKNNRKSVILLCSILVTLRTQHPIAIDTIMFMSQNANGSIVEIKCVTSRHNNSNTKVLNVYQDGI